MTARTILFCVVGANIGGRPAAACRVGSGRCSRSPLVAALGLALWLFGRSGPWRSPSGQPHFASCTYGGYVDGWCAHLRVAEDPRKPNGPMISLRIAVLPATKRPAAGALFYLEGGPGGAATAAAIRVNAFFAHVQRHRDLVMVDQRGTGGSRRLACPNGYVRRADATAVTALSPTLSRPARRRSAALHDECGCRRPGDRASHAGVRQDRSLRRLLRRDARSGVRASIPRVRTQRRSRRRLAAGCPDLRRLRSQRGTGSRCATRALRSCARLCSRLSASEAAARRAARTPAAPRRRRRRRTGKVLLRPDDIAWTVDWLSETVEDAALIPFAVNAAAHGDYTTLATTYADRLGGSNLEALARLVPFWIILCSEPWAAFDPAATARAGRRSYLAEAAVARARLFRHACAVVPKGRVPTDAASRRVVHAPTLLLAGGADPLDPTANLRGWRRLFPRGRLIVVPGAGHGTLEYDCVQKLIARFVDRASATAAQRLVCPARPAASVHDRIAGRLARARKPTRFPACPCRRHACRRRAVGSRSVARASAARRRIRAATSAKPLLVT